MIYNEKLLDILTEKIIVLEKENKRLQKKIAELEGVRDDEIIKNISLNDFERAFSDDKGTVIEIEWLAQKRLFCI